MDAMKSFPFERETMANGSARVLTWFCSPQRRTNQPRLIARALDCVARITCLFRGNRWEAWLIVARLIAIIRVARNLRSHARSLACWRTSNDTFLRVIGRRGEFVGYNWGWAKWLEFWVGFLGKFVRVARHSRFVCEWNYEQFRINTC